MQTKTLSDYQEHEFLTFVETIWNVETDNAHHDALIAHFDSIVDHPLGSDLLFRPEVDDDGNVNSPTAIVATLKRWHQQQGRVAFKGQVLSPPTNTTPLTPEQRATAASTLNLEKVRALAADVQQAEEQAGHALALLEQQSTNDPLADDPQQQLTMSLSALQVLEVVQYQAKKALDRLIRLEMTVQFAVNGATRDASSPYLDAALQAVILQEVAPASQRHAAALADVRARHPALYAQGVTMIERLQARIAQLAQSTGSGPGHAPLILNASSHSAGLHPALLLARPLGRELAQQQQSLTETFRSAIAELEWQATTQDTHPGTYADIMTFVPGAPSDDPRFALTVPLVEASSSDQPDWLALASARATVVLPFRLCSALRPASGGQVTGVKPFTHYCHVHLTASHSLSVPQPVRVRLAVRDEGRQAYRFDADDPAGITVLWQRESPAHPLIDAASPPAVALLRIPKVAPIERFADLAQVRFDDYVVVFPPEAGLDPLYLMLRDRREFTTV